MLNYSFSTVMMAVLTSSLLILITMLFLQCKGMLRAIGSQLVIVLLLLAMFRLFFPFEMPFCRNVNLSRISSGIIVKIRHSYFSLGKVGISVWFCLQCVWACGAVVSLLNLFRVCRIIRRHVRRYGEDVSAKEPYRSVFQEVCSKREAAMPILLVPGLDAPRQDRILHPRILLPKEMAFSEEQLRYIFRHELTHARHHDVLIKLLVNLLVAVYWWNPLMLVLRRQLDIILEVRVDDRVLSDGDKDTKCGYVATLMEVAVQAGTLLAAQRAANRQVSSNPMASGGISDLEGRLTMIYEKGRISVPLIILLLTVTLSLYSLSYAFILEAYAKPASTDYPKIMQEITSQEAGQKMHAVAVDGGYDIYWNDVYVEHTDSLTHYSWIPVTER